MSYKIGSNSFRTKYIEKKVDNSEVRNMHFKYAVESLLTFDEQKEITNINDAIELFEIGLYFGRKNVDLNQTIIEQYYALADREKRRAVHYFQNLKQGSIIFEYAKTDYKLRDVFWHMFSRLRCDISDDAFKKLVDVDEYSLYHVLRYKRIVDKYSTVLKNIFESSDCVANLLVGQYLLKSGINYYWPVSMTDKDREQIILSGILHDRIKPPTLLRIVNVKEKLDFLTEDIRFAAYKKYRELMKKITSERKNTLEVYVSIEDSEKFVEERFEGCNYVVAWSKQYLENTKNYEGIIRNIVILLDLVDEHYRCSFYSKGKSEKNLLEFLFETSIPGEYDNTIIFQIYNKVVDAKIITYICWLNKQGVEIERVIKYFYEVVLFGKYGVKDFSYNICSESADYLEKCKMMSTEFERMLRQYSFVVKYGKIEKLRLELPIRKFICTEVDSMLPSKYVYIKTIGGEVRKEIRYLFSDTTVIPTCVVNKYGCLYEAIENDSLTSSDFNKMKQGVVEYLMARGSVYENEFGLQLNVKRVSLLYDLFKNGCVAYYRWHMESRNIIDELLASGELESESKLFTRAEKEYVNYVMNSTFSNGLQLRNRYVHSSYSTDQKDWKYDYVTFLKITLLTMVKILEEFEMLRKIKVDKST